MPIFLAPRLSWTLSLGDAGQYMVLGWGTYNATDGSTCKLAARVANLAGSRQRAKFQEKTCVSLLATCQISKSVCV